MEPTDQELLQQYQRTRDPAILDALIRRHLDMVYSAAVRQVRDRHLAEDVAQAVFILFAQKAMSLSPAVVLGGWLYRTTGNVAVNAMRKQARRERHEQLAAAEAALRARQAAHAPQAALAESYGEEQLQWQQLAPRVDEAMNRLRSRYRDALVLRFFQGLSLAEVGRTLGVSEEAARKLVGRGLTQLRRRLAGAAPACSTAVLASALSARGVLEPAPAHLVQSVAQAAAQSAAGVTGTTAGFTLAKGTLIMTNATHIKTALVAALALLLLGGGATVTYLALPAGDTVVVPPTAASPSPGTGMPAPVAALPAANAAPQEVTQEVRTALRQVIDWTMGGDEVQLKTLYLLERPEYQPLADASEVVRREGNKLRQAVAKRFGDVPEDLAGFLPGGPRAFREQYVPNAPVHMNGDDAVVTMPPQTVPPAFRFRKVDGKWKMLLAGSFLPPGAEPSKAAQPMADIFMAMSEAYRQIAAEVEAGQCRTAHDVSSRLQARMQVMTQRRK